MKFKIYFLPKKAEFLKQFLDLVGLGLITLTIYTKGHQSGEMTILNDISNLIKKVTKIWIRIHFEFFMHIFIIMI